MPKRLSRDVNEAAFQMVRRSTGTEQPKVSQSDISRVMSAMGRKGGKIGGKRRLVTMTPEQRKEVALKDLLKTYKALWKKEYDPLKRNTLKKWIDQKEFEIKQHEHTRSLLRKTR